uniref:Uncharacterized protein n=1 Tax=viral metagenome TaxID=1070528 RepID=A0A6C0KLU3_9ZZZZ
MNSSITGTTDPLSMATVVGGYFGLSSGTILALFLLYRGLSGLSGKRLVADCSTRKGEVGFAIRVVPSTSPIEAKSIQSESVSASVPVETPVGASLSLEVQAVPKTS